MYTKKCTTVWWQVVGCQPNRICRG